MSNRKTALVTGASQGLGAAIAIGLAQDGFDVVITELDVSQLTATRSAVEAAGTQALAIALDVRDAGSIDRAMKSTTDALGRVDVLVNNAGVQLRRSALDVTPAEWDEVIATNLKGAFFMSQAVGRHLVANKRPGCIVSLASTFAFVGFAERSTYGISKGGIVQMTRMLAIEWAPHGIRVNAIAPGTVETPSRAALLADPEIRHRMIDRIPIKRFGTPEEMAGAVRYLVSPAGAYITGQTMLLDGGLTAY
ncbi:MAG: SDR family NAD(P)-dependent oxidoreductase [Burkholderiales bacterium]